MQVTLCDNLELSLQGKKELNEICCDGFLFEEVIILLVVGGKVETIFLLNKFHDVKDYLDLGHAQLLTKSVERSIAGAPVLCLFGGRFTNLDFLSLLYVFALNRFLDSGGPLFLERLKIMYTYNCSNELGHEVFILSHFLNCLSLWQRRDFNGNATICLLQRQLYVLDELVHHDTFVLLLLNQRQINPLNHICKVVQTTFDLYFLVLHEIQI